MRMLRSLTLILPVLILLTDPALAQKKGTAGFERLKSLVGDWQGMQADGKAVHISYKLVSSDTALMETLETGEESDMVTVYHLDGDRLMMTHYCAINNQPRMRAEVPAGEIKRLAFSFVDATNLPGPAAAHMHRLEIAFDDPDHFTQKWTFRKDGQDSQEVFRYERKK